MGNFAEVDVNIRAERSITYKELRQALFKVILEIDTYKHYGIEPLDGIKIKVAKSGYFGTEDSVLTMPHCPRGVMQIEQGQATDCLKSGRHDGQCVFLHKKKESLDPEDNDGYTGREIKSCDYDMWIKNRNKLLAQIMDELTVMLP